MSSSHQEGKLRLLNPLSIRFSQPRIAPKFKDGHLLAETSAEVYDTVPEPLSADVSAPSDSAPGAPPYETVLVPPFPPVRVISWRPKIRRPDGEAERDAQGNAIMGERAWFALDNRRLHTMQRAAAKRWPRSCCVVVRCIEEVPGTATQRELRKFRTTTEGRTVQVGGRNGGTLTWTWASEAPDSAAAAQAKVAPEGLCAEDLWDAVTWAPRAAAAALRSSEGGQDEEELEAESESLSPPATRLDGGLFSGLSGRRSQAEEVLAQIPPIPQVGANYLNAGRRVPEPCPPGRHFALPRYPDIGGKTHEPFSQGHYGVQDAARAEHARPMGYGGVGGEKPRVPVAPGRQSGYPEGFDHLSRPSKPQGPQVLLTECPHTGWQYIDPRGMLQGPFTLSEMRAWQEFGFFYPDLLMRCDARDQFVRFAQLWPPGTRPFAAHVIRYQA